MIQCWSNHTDVYFQLLERYIYTWWNIQNSSGTLNFNYNSTNELSLSSGGNLSLNGMLPSIGKHRDASISSLTNNQILQWNSSSGEWVNATISTVDHQH